MRDSRRPGRASATDAHSWPPLGDLGTGCGRSPDLSPTRTIRVVRVAFPDESSGYDAGVVEDAESPLRGSHGFTPCSLFSRCPMDRSGTSSRHMPFTSFRPTVTTPYRIVKAAYALRERANPRGAVWGEEARASVCRRCWPRPFRTSGVGRSSLWRRRFPDGPCPSPRAGSGWRPRGAA